MATNSTTAANLDKVGSLLGIKGNELFSLLDEEFTTISADPIESARHPSGKDEFFEFALEKIELYAKEQSYLTVIKKIIRRNDQRKFYFYLNELEAISRILDVIEKPGHSKLHLDSLDLYTLPPLLRRVRNLKLLNIFNNNLQDISLVATLSDLQVLLANKNQINNIEFLKNNHKLEILNLSQNKIKSTYEVIKNMPALRNLELARNRINDTQIKPILENPYLQKVVLANNPINAPLNILNDIVALRTHFGVRDFKVSEAVRKVNAAMVGDSGLSFSESNLTNDTYRPPIIGDNTLLSEPIETQAQPVAENTTGEVNAEPNAPEQEQKQTVTAETSTVEPGSATKDDHPASEAEQASEPKQYISNPIRNILLRGNPRDNLLDIEKLSSIFYNLIANSDSNGEHFFGLFGRWGRGKTFFWKYILDHRLDPKKYIPIEFHAWKYQDTPGIWAYLYNTLNEAYLGEKPKWYQLAKWIKYYQKILILNGQRGKLPLLVGFLVSLGVAVGIYYYNYYFKGDKTVQTVLRIGIPISAISMLVYITKTFKTDARKIILSLTSSVNFNSQLGFQHEIQQELKYLLKAWIPDRKPKKKKDVEQEKEEEEKVAQKRIFLFIDDIDRCSEDKIIQIVDYIRVLLHCPAIRTG